MEDNISLTIRERISIPKQRGLACCTRPDLLQFKGGTSLSKAWGLINRFSEDIDLAISRLFFDLPDDTPQQRTAIRRKAFHYIEGTLIEEMDKMLNSNGIKGYEIRLVTENKSEYSRFKLRIFAV
jgi:hypothetical protein